MRIRALTCAAAFAALPASAQEPALAVDLIPGHPVYHEGEHEAGVAMALSIGPGRVQTINLVELCEELRVAAGLGNEKGDDLRLETIFVVPYKGMVVEGLYLPRDGSSGSNALVRSKGVARSALDRIVSRAGIPPRVLDETNVEHEISCSPHEPVWSITWSDIRRIGDEEPEVVIERARQRFVAVHQSVVEHSGTGRDVQETAKRG